MFHIQVLLLLYPTLALCQGLPFLSLGTTDGVSTLSLGQVDDAASTAIAIPNGFLFGGNNETTVFVSSNGLFSFREAVTFCCPQEFPSPYKYIVAPYWADNDVRFSGSVSYEVHTGGNSLISIVNNFINNQGNWNFMGTWMLIADWNQVPQHPGTGIQTNSYQGILITNGTHSYTIFIYQCGMMQWSGEATIGFYSDGHFYENYNLTGSLSHMVACLSPNILYILHSPYEVKCSSTENSTEESKLWLYVGIGGGAGGAIILILLAIIFAGIFFIVRKPRKKRRPTMLEDRANGHSSSQHGNPPTDLDLKKIYYKNHGGGAMAPLMTFGPPVPARSDNMSPEYYCDSLYVKMDPAKEDGDGQYEELDPEKAWHIQYEIERATDCTLVNEGEYITVS